MDTFTFVVKVDTLWSRLGLLPCKGAKYKVVNVMAQLLLNDAFIFKLPGV